jgi:HK97 family phage prohead protease
MSKEIERRTTVSDATIEYRDMGNGERKPVIAGYAAVFNSESRNLGGFVETIHENAFDEVLAEGPDVIGVFNHDRNLLLGRTGNGTMKLTKDPYGLRYEITPNENTTIGRDVIEWVKDRTVVGSSFAFAIKRDGGDSWSTDGQRGIRKREVRAIGLLEDVGPVVRPAYDTSSVVVSRRAIEMALGESHRPIQTMANAAKRGLKLAQRAENVDSRLICVAERLANREIVSVEEVLYLSGVYERCIAAKATGWSGSPAWIEWQLAGGDAGEKWIARRSTPTVVPEQRAAPNELSEGDFVSWDGGMGRVEYVMRDGSLQGQTATADSPLAVITPFDDDEPEDYLVVVMVSELEKVDEPAAEADMGEERAAGDKSQSTPAPKKDQIKGSDKNKPGSAKNAGGKITLSKAARAGLQNKVRDHNAAMREDEKPSWSRTTLGQLLAVYRRGSGAYSTSHRAGVSRAAWAMARVNAYLYLLRNGKPRDAKYVTDNDLLPADHPKSSKERSHEVEVEERAVNLKPTAGMAAAAKRGLALHEAGRSGDGLKPETVARAGKIAAREELTPDHVREMRAWFRRHKVDKRPDWAKKGAETPGYTAWQLWGGDAAWRFSEAKVAQMENEMDNRDIVEGEEYESMLSPANLALAESYEAIAEEYGQFSQNDAHYMTENPFAKDGKKCGNCVFFESEEGRCYIVQGEIAADAVCKLWIIPEERMSEEKKPEPAPAVDEKAAEDMRAAKQAEEIAVKLANLKATILRTQLHSIPKG